MARRISRPLPSSRSPREPLSLIVRIPTANKDLVSHLNFPAFQNPGEDSFLGHHAVARLIKNRTPGVADFPDLSHLEESLRPHPEPGADRQAEEVQTLGRNIFGKIAR